MKKEYRTSWLENDNVFFFIEVECNITVGVDTREYLAMFSMLFFSYLLSLINIIIIKYKYS